ncbi:MAG: aminotransferase class IV [Patescibacteria group bacterium]|nr:aminotransferase class IV [Patescibacteria group bacterium]
MPVFYLNGDFVPEEQAKVGVLDLGLLRGYGVFEFLRAYSGKFFLLDKHLERFWNSARTVDLEPPLTKKKAKEILNKLLEKNEFGDAAVRMVLTGGTSPDGFTRPENGPNFFIIAQKLHRLPSDFYRQGVKLVTLEHERIYPRSKTLCYTKAFANHSRKDCSGAYEILYIKNGEIYEVSTGNFFLFKGDKLITAREGVLLGLTREVVLELARDSFEIEIRNLRVAELDDADEAFITSTNKEVLPVVQIDKTIIGTGAPGPKTQQVIKMFKHFISLRVTYNV